ncbi:MAG: hypothetical protein V4773_06770 [Verrucomicrobiota bacterium]
MSARLRSPAPWILLAVLALEFFLFDRFGARRFTGVYPRWNDQTQYLGESYTAFEYARAHGFFAALWQSLTNVSAQGTLHDFFALIAFKLTGASRSAALALNFLALAAWQLSLFAAVARASARPALGLAAALLPLALTGPWQDIPGSAYDFRLDHLAMCALGVTASCAWLADRFQSRAGSVLFGVAVGLTLLTRFLTGTYFVVIFGGLLAWIAAGSDRRRGLLHLALAASIAFVLAAPVFWINLATIREYYLIGHYLGPESTIRASNLSIVGALRFLGDQLLNRHLGWFVVIVSAAAALVFAFLRRGESSPAKSPGWFIGALFFFAPALVLFLHKQKSEVVVSALVPGLLILAATVWIAAARRASPLQLRLASALIVLAALGFFARQQTRSAFSVETLTETRRVNTLADEVYDRARRGGLRELRVGVDYITDALDAQALRIICYERQKVWLAIDMTLPTGIFEPDEPTVMARLAESDFFFLTAEGPEGGFPYDRKLVALRPQLRAWCDAHLRVANEFHLGGRRMLLYQRRNLPFP